MLERIYGNNSTTTFRIRFGEPVSAHINFLQREGDRLLLHFVESNIVFHSIFDHKGASVGALDVNLTSGRWYDVQIAIEDYRFSISIDGRLLKRLDLDERLPSQGHLNFECHDEY